MFSALHQYREEGSFEGWVRRIMVNTALQRFRSHSALRAIVTLDFSHELMAEEGGDLDARLSAKELLALVQELPSAYRMVFNLYVFEGYQHKEIASMLGISEGTSKSNLHDARRWLKERIASQEKIDNLKKLYL
jgi:RNA polymerase sigma-70 factor (ECF subfamily)